MTVIVQKPEFNLREKLSELDFGTLPYEKAPSGSIIQVVQTVKQDQFTSTSSSYVNVTDFNATITPRFNSSKILVIVMTTVQTSSHRLRMDVHFSSGNGQLSSTGLISGSSNAMQAYEGNSVNLPAHLTFLHSPNTKNPATYQLRALNTNGSQFFVCATSHTGTMTLMEVKQ